MLCLLVSFAFSFGAACCFRFIPVFWVHVFACIRFVFFTLGPQVVFVTKDNGKTLTLMAHKQRSPLHETTREDA